MNRHSWMIRLCGAQAKRVTVSLLIRHNGRYIFEERGHHRRSYEHQEKAWQLGLSSGNSSVYFVLRRASDLLVRARSESSREP
jgi:hypothetical protein